jgi:hypothetical protein
MTDARDEHGRGMADHEAILTLLVDREVDFLLAGGLAVSLHGYVRATRDVDVIPAPDATNLGRLAEALRDLNAQAVGARGERLALDLTHPESLAIGNYFLDTRLGALDLFNGPRPDLKRYRRLEGDAVPVAVGGREIKVIAKADLIAMKREAGRPKDLADIAALTEVERSGPGTG